MSIPSARTLRDLETVAELRATGASWETAAAEVRRHPNVLMRWARVYRDEWDRLLREAEDRWSRQASNESRSVLRILLRAKSSKVRLAAAGKLAQHRLDEKAREPPPDPHVDRTAYVAYLEEMSDEQLHAYLAEFVRGLHAEGGAGAVANPPGPPGPG